MSGGLWFGHPLGHMQWVPKMRVDSSFTMQRHMEQMQFENGGGTMLRSNQFQKRYNLSFLGPAHEADGIDAFRRFQSGFYGGGLVHFPDPTQYETNLFNQSWAAPGLIEQGWANIAPNMGLSFADTPANSNGLPSRSAVFKLPTDPGDLPDLMTDSFFLPIPPNKVLHLGWTGSKIDSGSVSVFPILAGGGYSPGDVVALTPLSATGSIRTNATFSGSAYQAVAVQITNSGAPSLNSAVTVTAMNAQLLNPGQSADQVYYDGGGSTGLDFATDVLVENYSYMHPPRKGTAFELVEVGAWR